MKEVTALNEPSKMRKIAFCKEILNPLLRAAEGASANWATKECTKSEWTEKDKTELCIFLRHLLLLPALRMRTALTLKGSFKL